MIRLPSSAQLPVVAAYTDARLAWVEAVLERAADPARAVEDPRPAVARAATAAAGAGCELPDAQLAHRFALTAAELDVMWLVAAPAIDPTLVTLLRKIDGSPRDWVDAVVAARALAGTRAHRQALYADLGADARLRATRLVRVLPGEHPARREIVPAPWLPAALGGVRALGARLDGIATLVTPSITVADVPLPTTSDELVRFLGGAWRDRDAAEPRFDAAGLDHPRGVAVVMTGRPGTGRHLLARAIAGHLGRRILTLDAASLRGIAVNAVAEVVEAAASEAAAWGELLYLDNAHEWVAAPGGVGTAHAAIVARAIATHPVVAILAGVDDGALAAEVDELVVFRHQHVVRPQSLDCGHLWLLNLPAAATLDDELDLDAFARSINLTPAQVRSAARAAVATSDGQPLGVVALDQAARAQVVQSIGSLAEVSTTSVSINDLILTEDAKNQLEQIISAARNRDLVLRRWGLRRTIKRGLAITCLFDGTPGTGKTLAAEVIAHELGLSLLRINVASIVDKYIGETEKNLTRIFEQARPDTTMLLFDEADSLFTKRTEVQHASDRFSNMNVNVLLQLVERFEGTAVLTTNLKKGLDVAFERRITFKLTFERPEAPEREQIWRLMLPPSVPTAERIDYTRLAKLELSGGEIKNSVLRAAYAAAREGTELRMRHLTAAAAEEAAASGRVYLDGANAG